MEKYININYPIAKKLNSNCAIVFDYFYFYLQKDNNSICNNKEKWYKASIQEIHNDLQILSERQIRVAIDKMIAIGLLKKKKLEKSKMNQSYFYCVNELMYNTICKEYKEQTNE